MFVSLNSWKYRKDNSYKGDVLYIEEICLPYILVWDFIGINKLDTREITLQKLSDKYIKLYLEQKLKTEKQYGVSEVVKKYEDLLSKV